MKKHVFFLRTIICVQSLVVFSSLFSGCKKFLEIDPPVEVMTDEAVFKDKASAVAAMTGVYSMFADPGFIFTGFDGLSIRTALRADELTPSIPEAYPDYLNNTTQIWGMWTTSYREYIYRINALLEGLKRSTGLDQTTKNVLIGEAKFSRAFLYFYLLNFYGDVPLVLTTDFKFNSNVPRTSAAIVYQQIVADLKDAQASLKDEFLSASLNTSSERVRPNKAAATAFLARVFLYQAKWAEAEKEASAVIENPTITLENDLDNIFLKDSKEAIWQLQSNGIDPQNGEPLDQESSNTPDGRWLINPFEGDAFFRPSDPLLSSFEPGDDRAKKWIALVPTGFYVIFKYKQGWGTRVQLEHTIVLRLAEQYLIRAEARAHLSKLTGSNSAQSDLDLIRNRAGLGGTSATTQEGILEAIIHERRVELFLEWGHRWLDLKRTGKLDAEMRAMAPIKGGSWQPFKALLPIPLEDFQFNTALRGHQNPGYAEQ